MSHSNDLVAIPVVIALATSYHSIPLVTIIDVYICIKESMLHYWVV